MRAIIKHYKKIWWAMLIIAGITYLFLNRPRVFVNPNNTDTMVIIIVMILAFMPLVSEINIFGIGMKREIENVKYELKDEIRSQFQVIQNSNQSNISISTSANLSVESVKNDLKRLELTEDSEDEDIEEADKVATKLFKTRYYIETKLNAMNGYFASNSSRNNMRNSINLLVLQDVIEREIAEYIAKIIAICNRAIHGEKIEKSYLEYVEKIFPRVKEELDRVNKEMIKGKFIKCTKCGYYGTAKLENVCPICGFITDEY